MHKAGAGFTLIELLVVLSIVSLLTGVLLPVLGKARRQGRVLQGMNNLRQIALAVNVYATDNDGGYPESVATIGFGGSWHWEAPTMLTGYDIRDPGLHRAMSEYLRRYMRDASIMFCPNAPYRYKYLQESWDAGDDWVHPVPTPRPDPVYGTYCFYWNYTGFMEEPDGPFRGPWGPSCGRRYSKLLVSDYFGYDQWRRRNAYGSCERFKHADVIEESWFYSACWSVPKLHRSVSRDVLRVKLHAAYTDGHVASYRPSEVVPMWVSTKPDGSSPDTIGPGIFYLPRGGPR